MPAAARPYVLASAVLMATGLVAATPLPARPFQLPDPQYRDPAGRRRLCSQYSGEPVRRHREHSVQRGPGLGHASGFALGHRAVVGAGRHECLGLGPLGLHPRRGGARIVVTIPVAGSRPRRPRLSNRRPLGGRIPQSASCDAATCAPIVPHDVITGISAIDQDIATFDVLTGADPIWVYRQLVSGAAVRAAVGLHL